MLVILLMSAALAGCAIAAVSAMASAAGNMSTFHGRLRCCCSCGQQASLLDSHCLVDRRQFRNVPSSKAAEQLAQLLANSTLQPSLFKLPQEIDSRLLLTRLADLH